MFVPSDEMFNTSHFSRTVKPLADFKNDDPLVLNVQFHIVRDDDGNNVYGVEEEHLLASIAQLNIAMNSFNIFFKYRGYTFIDESDYLSCYGEDDWNYLRVHAIAEGNYNYENINVFVTGIPNMATFDVSDVYMAHSTIKSVDKLYLKHEFGHALSLLHIFEGTTSINQQIITHDIPDSCLGGVMKLPSFDGYIPNPVYPSAPENVTRDVNNSDYNADEAGDLVIDTNACFRGLNANCCYDTYYNYYEFYSHPDVVDITGELYIDLSDERTNYMHYGGIDMDHFSEGQGVRMRESIDENVNGHLQEKLTTVESLYEPYKMEWVEYPGDDDILLSSGLTFGRQNVPTGYWLSYFQPGFDYEIYNCIALSDGTTYTGDLAFSYPVSETMIPTFDQQGHQIKILQVGDDLSECTPHMLSPFVMGGSVYSWENNTLQVLDSTNINSVDLYNNLPNGTHTININTNTNETSQKTILKDNE